MNRTNITSASFIVLFALVSIGVAAADNRLTPSYRTATWRKDMTHDFKVMDTNRDGKVDMAEWQSHTNPLHPEFARNHVKPDRRRLTRQEMDSVWHATAGLDNLITMDEYVADSNPMHPQFGLSKQSIPFNGIRKYGHC